MSSLSYIFSQKLKSTTFLLKGEDANFFILLKDVSDIEPTVYQNYTIFLYEKAYHWLNGNDEIRKNINTQKNVRCKFMKIVKKQWNHVVVLIKYCLIKAHQFPEYLFAVSPKYKCSQSYTL